MTTTISERRMTTRNAVPDKTDIGPADRYGATIVSNVPLGEVSIGDRVAAETDPGYGGGREYSS